MTKIVISLAIVHPDGKEEIVEVLDYIEIGSRQIETQPQNQEQLLLFEAPLSKWGGFVFFLKEGLLNILLGVL